MQNLPYTYSMSGLILADEIRENLELVGRPARALESLIPERYRGVHGIVESVEVLGFLDTTRSQRREREFYDLVVSGYTPLWNLTWWPLEFLAPDAEGRERVVHCWVRPDYLSIGTDDQWVYVSCGAITAEAIGKTFGAALPTRALVKRIYAAAPQKLVAEPWGPPYDATMMATSRLVAQARKIRRQFDARKFSRGVLTEGHLKSVVVGQGIAKNSGQTVGIFGWFRSDGSVIQGPETNFHSHEVVYCDYSHGIRFVKEEVKIDGQADSYSRVLLDPLLACLFSDEQNLGGVLAPPRYLAVHGAS